MCGISGIVSLDGRPVRQANQRIKRMNALLKHRGPDQKGVWCSENGLVALGNTRLSIVGVQDAPQLPLRVDGNCLAFNGEIYDHKDQRSRALEKGDSFVTSTDTEVLLRGMIRNGVEYCDELDGVWAFAFFDQIRGKLFLARDLMGEKSLYYLMGEGELIFASEIPAILGAIDSSLDWDISAIISSFQYRAPGNQRTLLDGIRKVPPGCALCMSPGCSGIEELRLQQLNPHQWTDFFADDPSLEEICEVLEGLLETSCARRLPEEVSYMSTLSGGIDSSLVNFFLSARGTKKIDSLFGHSSPIPQGASEDMDEFAASQFTALKLGNHHTEFVMYGRDAVELYKEDAATSFDGVFCEGVTNFRQLSRFASSLGKRVLVTSDGPDELLGGYNVDVAAYRVGQRLNRLTPEQKATLSKRVIRKSWSTSSANPLLNWSYLNSCPFAVRPNHGGTAPNFMAELFEQEHLEFAFKAFGRIPDCYADMSADLDMSQCVALAYASSSLPEYVNTRSDRGSMRESVEIRMPFQALYVVEFLMAVPEKWRFLDGKWSKYILRKMVDRHLGPNIAFRKKYGFAQPIWKQPDMAKEIGIYDVVAGSPMFRDLPFRRGARDALLAKGQERNLWMAFCLASTYENYKAMFRG